MSQTKPVPTAQTSRPNTGSTVLRAQNVRRSFQMGDVTIPVLKGVDIAIRDGEFVAIEGRSGSGKSTLLHVLGALDGIDDGSVEFDGKDYTRHVEAQMPTVLRILSSWIIFWVAFVTVAVSLLLFGLAPVVATYIPLGHWIALILLIVGSSCAAIFSGGWISRAVLAHINEQPAAEIRRRDFGFVFQFYHLLPELNVLENTLLTPMIENSWFGFRSQRKALSAHATKLLESLGLSHRLKHRPNQLSGGERQRVAIARALMNNPRVLFADEPTGNLDIDTGRQIMNLLEKLHREGQTIVMVTHDRALAREADRVLVLKDGKLEKAE